MSSMNRSPASISNLSYYYYYCGKNYQKLHLKGDRNMNLTSPVSTGRNLRVCCILVSTVGIPEGV